MKDLLDKAAEAGIRFEVSGDDLRVLAPRGAMSAELQQALRDSKPQLLARLRAGDAAAQQPPALQPDPAARHDPFPLTELQHAYWVGRAGHLELGGTSTHCYVEFDCGPMDPARLNQALRRLIERHDMLRAVVYDSGQQRILPTVPAYEMPVQDLSAASPGEIEHGIDVVRQALSHQILSPGRWPLFDIRATRLPEGRLRLHVSLDMLMFDAGSVSIFFSEWGRLCRQPDAALPAIGVSFRDYVLGERSLRGGEAHARAHRYWFDRIDSLPPAPQLPVRPRPARPAGAPAPVRFTRRQASLDRARWQRLAQAAGDRGITASNLLLALYAQVLARWSASPQFTVNVAVSSRLPLHPLVGLLLGDFTVPVLHEIDARNARVPFAAFALGVQQRLLDDLAHRALSGVSVLREWARRHGSALQATMPVVFTSALGWTADAQATDDIEVLGDPVFGSAQTSQVWLDHHVLERRGELVCIWDAVDTVFDDGVPDAMFAAYRAALQRLADDPAAWDGADLVPLPPAMQARRDAFNRTDHPTPQGRLHADLVAHALSHPDDTALITAERILRYHELISESAAVADRVAGHAGPGCPPIAILMDKGWQQVVAACGVLLAGAAYLPVDVRLPRLRQLELLRQGGVRLVLTQADWQRGESWPPGFEVLAVDGTRGTFTESHRAMLQGPDDALAYVIFTSGTTGVPKGVMIDHRGARNTLFHVNRLLGIGRGDRVLGVSSLGFDLSVYDIFGVLGAGGALVLPDASKAHDAAHWQQLMTTHGVTLWNSAPQLMGMLMDAGLDRGGSAAPLRTVLLSGDFIPVDLPDRIRARHPHARVISLGGATEASVWSIHHPIDRVDPAWASIPYGQPLPNQRIHVLDHALRPCPDHVTGRIHIAGLGLAPGYWRDDALTAARFITSPWTGERLYDTGDLGRHVPDGQVFILGRADGQVKIRGHRVELGEIESVLLQHPAVRQACVQCAGPTEHRRLVAYLVPADGMTLPPARAIQDHLALRLPEHMVPQRVVPLQRMPLSANGKIDHRALPAAEEGAAPDVPLIAPRDAIEAAIHAVWTQVMSGRAIGVTENFFDAGGDSVLATTLVHALATHPPGLRLQIHELFEHLTIEAQARLHHQRCTAEAVVTGSRREALSDAPADVLIDVPLDATPDPTAMLADVAAGREAVSAMAFSRTGPAPAAAPRTVLLTGATGWVGAHVLAELLARTDARICCLVRAGDEAAARARIGTTLLRLRLAPGQDLDRRVVPVCADLAQPRLGLSAPTWQRLAEEVDTIHHFAASLDVLAGYAAHRATNVQALLPLLSLAGEHHAKALHVLSPMTVCRRWREGRLVVLHEEREHTDADGLLSGYAQSKWAAEQILLTAYKRGLQLTLYRTTHALPSSASALAKAEDTCVSVLRAACAAGVVPDWPASRLQGVPVDVLARLLVEHALSASGAGGVVHIDNHDPLSLPDIVQALQPSLASVVPLADWLARCRGIAAQGPAAQASLLGVLFAPRASSTAVENLFAAHPVDTRRFAQAGLSARLAGLTPPAYWLRLRQAMAPCRAGSPEALA